MEYNIKNDRLYCSSKSTLFCEPWNMECQKNDYLSGNFALT